MLSPSEHLWRFIPTEFSWTQERVALCHRAPTLSRWKLGESKPSIFRGSDPHRPHLPAPARSRALRSARAVNTRTRSRLYSTDPRRSSLGWAARANIRGLLARPPGARHLRPPEERSSQLRTYVRHPLGLTRSRARTTSESNARRKTGGARNRSPVLWALMESVDLTQS